MFMENVNVKVVYLENYNGGEGDEKLHYKHEGDSGFDLRAGITDHVTVFPFEQKVIPSGCKFVFPEGTELQVRPRSGMSLKGLTVANSPGTVDSSYRGEVGIIVANISKSPITIYPGDRIAQAVIMPVLKANLIKISEDELSDTSRGEGAYNSTGNK